MTSPTTPDHEPAAERGEEGGDDLKRRLLLRVGIAAALIVALLGGLAVLDEMNAPPPKPAEVVAEAPTRPTSPAPAATTQVPPLTEEKPAEPATEETKKPEESSVAAAQETSAPPTTPTAPSGAPSAAEVPEATGPGRRPLTRPATPRLAMLKPSEAASAVKLPPQAPLRAEANAELARQAQPHVATQAPASRPLTQAVARGAAAGGAGYLLQLGVFSSTAHAEELRAKLELNGIPAQIEARVQVGPFANREEAEQMRDKLRKLGLEGGVLVATKK